MRRKRARRNRLGGLKKPRVFVTTSDKAAKKGGITGREKADG